MRSKKNEGVLGYLPDIYKDIKKQYPAIGKAYDELALACLEWGPLDARTRRLVKLGIAIGLVSDGGVRSHVRRALEEGITPDEIRHAVLLSLTTAGFEAMAAAMKWTEEVLSKYAAKPPPIVQL